MFYQQGDVCLISCCCEPAGKVKTDGIVAYGEVTGHCHKVIVDGELVKVIENEKGELYVKAQKPFSVVHEEHKTIEVPAGVWKIGKVREFDHFAEEARFVQD
jgi:hypothetical protein